MDVINQFLQSPIVANLTAILTSAGFLGALWKLYLLAKEAKINANVASELAAVRQELAASKANSVLQFRALAEALISANIKPTAREQLLVRLSEVVDTTGVAVEIVRHAADFAESVKVGAASVVDQYLGS